MRPYISEELLTLGKISMGIPKYLTETKSTAQTDSTLFNLLKALKYKLGSSSMQLKPDERHPSYLQSSGSQSKV